METRLFAFNSGTTISGTTQVGNIAVGGYLGQGGLQWWSGPDETNRYIICAPIPSGNQPTPFGNNAYIGFCGTIDKSDQSFIDLINVMAAQSYTTVNDCLCWLSSNGMWSSYSGTCVTTTTTTISSYSFSVGLGSTGDEACSNFFNSPTTVYSNNSTIVTGTCLYIDANLQTLVSSTNMSMSDEYRSLSNGCVSGGRRPCPF